MSLTPYLDLGENFMRFGVKAIEYALIVVLLVLLMGAWIVTVQTLKLLYGIIRAAKRFAGKERMVRRPKNH